jgi:chaperonin cofactor prefoldin
MTDIVGLLLALENHVDEIEELKAEIERLRAEINRLQDITEDQGEQIDRIGAELDASRERP